MHFLCPPESAVISKMGRETLAKVGVSPSPVASIQGARLEEEAIWIWEMLRNLKNEVYNEVGI